MSFHSRSAGLLLTLCCLASPPVTAQVSLPPGWRLTSADPAQSGSRRFEATGLPSGESITVTEGPSRPRAGAAVDAWLAAAVANDAAPTGRWATPVTLGNARTGAMATVAREFVAANGVRGARIYIGLASGEQQAKLLTLTVSSAATLATPRGAAARALMTELAAASLKGAGMLGPDVASSRAVSSGPTRSRNTPRVGRDMPTPQLPVGIRAGGPIVPGRYTGTMVNNEGKVIVQYDVTLFANGEYAAPRGDNLLDSTGTYVYVDATGRIDIDGKLHNSTYSPDEDFCVFGRDATGAPILYAEDYYGVGTFSARLRRVSDVSRDPPSVVLAARKAEEAEASRYKFVTAPGAGLRTTDIEAVYYEWKQVYEITGLQFKEELFLLLTDGSVRRGIPVAPQDLDVARSRKQEPESWGRWRKAAGAYEFAFGAARAFARKQGYAVQSARTGAVLQGTYEGSSSAEIPGGAGAWAKFGVRFQPGARFAKFRTGGAGMSSGYGDTRVVSTSAYDDEGSAGGVSSTVFSGGGARTTPDTGNRRGTYRIDGYAIILTYDNGSVERLPFVIEQSAGGDVKGVWMLGGLLTPAKK